MRERPGVAIVPCDGEGDAAQEGAGVIGERGGIEQASAVRGRNAEEDDGGRS